MLRCAPLWLAVLVCSIGLWARADEPAKPAAEQLQKDYAEAAMAGQKAMQAGNFSDGLKHLEKALPLVDQLYPADKFPNGHISPALVRLNIAACLSQLGRQPESLTLNQDVLARIEKLYPPEKAKNGQPYLVMALVNLALNFEKLGDLERAIPLYQRALEQRLLLYPEDRFPNGHIELVKAYSTLSAVHGSLGKHKVAAEYCAKLVALSRRMYPPEKFPNGHPDLLNALQKMGETVEANEQFEDAENYLNQALKMARALYPQERFPNGHASIAQALFYLGMTHLRTTRLEQAKSYLEESLAMRLKLYPAERFPRGHKTIVFSYRRLGSVYSRLNDLERARDLLAEAAKMARTLYVPPEYPAGDETLASVLTEFSEVLWDLGDPAKALEVNEDAVKAARALVPRNVEVLARALNYRGLIYKSLNEEKHAIPFYEEALAVYRAAQPKEKFPHGSQGQMMQLNNLSVAYSEMGQLTKAQEMLDEAIAMGRKLYSVDPKSVEYTLANALNNRSSYLDKAGRIREAIAGYEEALALMEKAGLGDTVVVIPFLSNLALMHQQMGQYAQSIARLERAGEIARSRKRPGKTAKDLEVEAAALQNFVAALIKTRQFERALPIQEELVINAQKRFPPDRFPKGHLDLADAHHNLVSVLAFVGKPEQAMQYADRSLAMFEQLVGREHSKSRQTKLIHSYFLRSTLNAWLRRFDQATEDANRGLELARTVYSANEYPKGHDELVLGLTHLGTREMIRGRYTHALTPLREAVEMLDRLNAIAEPVEHQFDAADTVRAYGISLHKVGRSHDALPVVERALASKFAFFQSFANRSAEIEGLNFLRSLIFMRDDVLAVGQAVSESDARVYSSIWKTKSAVMDVFQSRHTAARLATANDADARRHWDELLDVRNQLSHLATQPSRDIAARDQQVRALTQRKETLERSLARSLPELKSSEENRRLAPPMFARRLPARSAWIDLYWFDNSYSAFVLGPSGTLKRIELGSAIAINADVAAWREDIAKGRDSAASRRLAKRVWEPLAKAIPADTQTLFVCPDGDLALVPWGALPIDSSGAVLLEQFEGGIAIIPSATWFFNQIASPPGTAEVESVLAVGGAVYDSAGGYSPLPGTLAEVKAIMSLAGNRTTTLTGVEASSANLMRHLPKARIAHVATHGYFADAELAAERRMLAEQLKNWKVDPHSPTQLAVSNARSPMLFVGLALSGATRLPGTSPTAQSVVTGEMILGLPLEDLRLCVLSACETGLGDDSGGDGVFGLVRALHIAGCRNVVSSLWNVNDAATAALMAKFYHELWVNKREPLAALREAQLFIYHHPELIPDALGERGAPKRAEALAVKTVPAAPAKVRTKRADTKLWAAFVLSGAGK